MTDAEFLRFCQDNRDLNIERNAQREIIIMSPTHTSTGFVNLRIATQIDVWTQQSQLGIAFDSSAGFTLPDGSMRSPDVSWVALQRWQQLTEAQKEGFAAVCPDFVLELKSKTDRLSDLQEKMESYVERQRGTTGLVGGVGRRNRAYLSTRAGGSPTQGFQRTPVGRPGALRLSVRLFSP